MNNYWFSLLSLGLLMLVIGQLVMGKVFSRTQAQGRKDNPRLFWTIIIGEMLALASMLCLWRGYAAIGGILAGLFIAPPFALLWLSIHRRRHGRTAASAARDAETLVP